MVGPIYLTTIIIYHLSELYGWSHLSDNTTLPQLSQPHQVSVGPGDLPTSPLGLSSQLLFGTHLIYTPALSATGGWADEASKQMPRLSIRL